VKEFKPGDKVLIVIDGVIKGEAPHKYGLYKVLIGGRMHRIPDHMPMLSNTEANRYAIADLFVERAEKENK